MVNSSQNLISVVVPVFQEDESLPSFLAGIRDVLDQCAVSYELVLVDDGSSDNSWPIILKEANASPSVRGFRLSRNFGKEAALCAGLEKAKGSAVIIMDGDGQHPASLLPEMIRMWQSTGADIVQAVKQNRGRESFSNKASALLSYFLFKPFSAFI